jgi:hypothetical protein
MRREIDRRPSGALRLARSPRTWALFGALVLACSVVFHAATRVPIGDPTLQMAGEPPKSGFFPFMVESAPGKDLDFAFTIHEGRLTQSSVVVIADNLLVSLSANGETVPLSGIPAKQLADYTHGFRFPIGRYLRPGDNVLVARVHNVDGPGGLDVESDPQDWRSRAETVGAIAGSVLLLCAALRLGKVRWAMALSLAAGTALRLAYLTATPYTVRTHDLEGHLEYVEYLVHHGALPHPYDGWSFYQPPLYFALAAGLWRALAFAGFGRAAILQALQLQSLLYDLGFLGFSLATVSLWFERLPDSAFGRRLSSRSGLLALLAALVCVWPSSIVHSVRIGNDGLFYLFFGAGLFFVSRWWSKGKNRDLYLAAASGALGMVTKTNSVVLFALIGVLYVARFALDENRKIATYLRRAWPVAALFVLSAVASLGRAALDTLDGKRSNLFVGNVGRLRGDLTVGNGAQNYLWFDTKAFVTQAFASPFDDAAGRQFFANVALKTSLLGEFTYDHPRPLSDIAVVMSVLLLFVVVAVGATVALSARADLIAELPALAALALLVAALAALRMSIPMACSNDFRYILPVLTPALYMYVRGLAAFRSRGWTRLSSAGVLVGWSLVAGSALFFSILCA